jgi:hypothetical protein
LPPPSLTFSDKDFVGFLAGLKTGADVLPAADRALGLNDFPDGLGTGIAAIQNGISAAETLVRGDEFLIENNQQDGEEFHRRRQLFGRKAS